MFVGKGLPDRSTGGNFEADGWGHGLAGTDACGTALIHPGLRTVGDAGRLFNRRVGAARLLPPTYSPEHKRIELVWKGGNSHGCPACHATPGARETAIDLILANSGAALNPTCCRG